MHARAKLDTLQLNWRTTDGATEKAISELVIIVRSPARFAQRPCGRGRGAISTYFLCPGCKTRRRKLYLISQWCRCRDCLGLGWTVEGESALDRSLRRSSRARARLDVKPGILSLVPPRSVPAVARRGGRGAGRRKYLRLVASIRRADLEVARRLATMAERLEASVERTTDGGH